MESTRRYQVLYFVYFASFSGFVAFRNVLLEEMGMSGVQMGLIGSLWVIGGVVAQPAWGLVADYTQSPTRVLAVAATLSGVAILSYPIGGTIPSQAFLIVAVGTFAYSATRAPIIPIANSLVLRQGFDYGYVRSFGSIAFGLTVLVIGFALAGFATGLVIYLYIAGMIVFVSLVVRLPRVDDAVFEGSLGSQAIGLFRQPQFLVVLGTAFALGTVSSSGSAFFSVYMREVGLGDSLTGVAWALKTVAEAIFFIYIGRTALTYGGIIVIGGLSYTAGYLGLGVLPSLAPVLLANFGLGIGVALLYFALVNLAHECAPEGLHSTAQTLLTSIGVGAGGAVGQTAAGWLVDAVGVQRMYLYLGGAALVLVLAGILVRAVVTEGRATAA